MPAAPSERRGVQGGNPQVENLRPLSGRNLRRLKTCGHEKPAATCEQGERGAARAREPAFVSSASQDDEAEETPSERRAGCPQRASGDGARAAPSGAASLSPSLTRLGFLSRERPATGHGRPRAVRPAPSGAGSHGRAPQVENLRPLSGKQVENLRPLSGKQVENLRPLRAGDDDHWPCTPSFDAASAGSSSIASVESASAVDAS